MRALLLGAALTLLGVPALAQSVNPSGGGIQPGGAAGGSLSGTYPNPSIASGVTLTTPVIGVATGTSLALGVALQAGDTLDVYNAAASAQQQEIGDGQFAFDYLNTYGTAVWPVLRPRTARGTFALPTTVVSGDTVFQLGAQAWDGTAYRAVGGLIGTLPTVTGTNNLTSQWCLGSRVAGVAAGVTQSFCVDQLGHLDASATSTAPTVASCGTGSPTITGNSVDNAGSVTTGTTATTCQVNFGISFTNTPICLVQDNTALVRLLTVTVTSAHIAMTLTSNTGDLISWHCWGQGTG